MKADNIEILVPWESRFYVSAWFNQTVRTAMQVLYDGDEQG